MLHLYVDDRSNRFSRRFDRGELGGITQTMEIPERDSHRCSIALSFVEWDLLRAAQSRSGGNGLDLQRRPELGRVRGDEQHVWSRQRPTGSPERTPFHLDVVGIERSASRSDSHYCLGT